MFADSASYESGRRASVLMHSPDGRLHGTREQAHE